jgi:hypothetical protein
MKTKIPILAFLTLGLQGYAQTDTLVITKTDTSFYQRLEERKHHTTEPLKEYKSNDRDKDKDKDKDKEQHHRTPKFEGHWAGIELGINNYLSKQGSTNISGENEYMDLRPTRSLNFNINIFKLNYGIVSDRFGFVSGMGIEWYNYFFANSNSIMRDSTGIITSRTFADARVDKSKLTNMFLSVPLLLEFNLPGSESKSHRFHISTGIIGAVLVSAHTKVVYTRNGDEKTDKDWGNLNLNYLRYGFTTRVGYGNMSVYGTYYPVSLFQTGKGPELYPFSVGLSWHLFN